MIYSNLRDLAQQVCMAGRSWDPSLTWDLKDDLGDECEIVMEIGACFSDRNRQMQRRYCVAEPYAGGKISYDKTAIDEAKDFGFELLAICMLELWGLFDTD